MNTSESIIIGIIAGLITSALIYLCIKIFDNIIKPWYQNIIYSGVRIDGQWANQKQFRNGEAIQDGLFELKQHTNNLTGIQTTTIRYKSNKEIEIKTFKLKGFIKDRFVLIYMENTDLKKIGLVSGLYELGSGGDMLFGCESWTDVGSSSIGNGTSNLTRKK